MNNKNAVPMKLKLPSILTSGLTKLLLIMTLSLMLIGCATVMSMASTATDGPVHIVLCRKLRPIEVSRRDTKQTQDDAGRAKAVWVEVCQ